MERWLLLQEPTVGFASLSSVRRSKEPSPKTSPKLTIQRIAVDVESQDLSRSVPLLGYWRNDELTGALRHRQNVSKIELVLPLLLRILANPENHVLVLGSEVGRKKGFFLFLIAMLACLAVGVLVGVLLHSVELGFTCGGGALTVLAAVEASLFWACR